MRRAEQLASIFVVALGLAVVYYAREHLKLGMLISPGAGFLPFGVGVAFVVLGVAMFAMTLLGQPPSPRSSQSAAQVSAERTPTTNRVLTRLLPGVAFVLTYAWLFERAGFVASTVAFMVGWQRIVEGEGWRKTLLIALASAATLYALFSLLLKGVLPAGAWFA